MKDKQLLSLVLSDAEHFREQLLNETLGHVRRKRRTVQGRRVLIATAIVAVVIWSVLPRPATLKPRPGDTGLHIVRTHPLSVDHVVATRPDSVTVITSDKSTFALLEDDRLLKLVPGETKLLVWHAPNKAELVIIGP